jgi:hypothetical protein
MSGAFWEGASSATWKGMPMPFRNFWLFERIAMWLRPISSAFWRRAEWLWDRIEPLTIVLKAAQTPILCAFFGIAGLTLTNQGREIGFSFIRPESLGLFTGPSLMWWAKHVLALCYLALWGVGCMNVARLLVNGLRAETQLKTHLPAYLGCGCFGAGIFVLANAWQRLNDDGSLLSLAVSIGLCVALVVLVIYVAVIARGTPSRLPSLKRLYDRGSHRFSWILFAIAMATVTIATAAFWIAPGRVGFWAGSPLVIFAFLASLTGILGFLAIGARSAKIPVLTGLFVWALIASVFPSNHNVRKLEQNAKLADISDAIDEWQKRNPEEENGLFRPVIIASAGGGLRAAFWTTTLLSNLDERVRSSNDGRRQDIAFAISGVSGGSVGATFYAASLATNDKDGTTCNSQTSRMQQVRTAVGRDFLAATLGSMFFPDLAARFFPISAIPDRAAAMEMAFETTWRDISGCRTMEQGIAELPQQIRFPHLLLNSTDTYTGRRVVVSSLELREYDNFLMPEVIPFFDYHRNDISLSTAAMLSARFTFISPAGNVDVQSGKGQLRLVDGGYFENYGADTAADLLQALDEKFRAKMGSVQNRDLLKSRNAADLFKPIVIQISSDPALAGSEMPKVGECDTDAGDALLSKSKGIFRNFAEEVLAPIEGLLSTREARGLLAAKRLACLTHAYGGRYFNFRMKSKQEKQNGEFYEPPLGWLLSPQSQQQIELQLKFDQKADMQTCVEFELLLAELNVNVDAEKCLSEKSWDQLSSEQAHQEKAR